MSLEGGISLGFDSNILKKKVNKIPAYLTPVIYSQSEKLKILRDLADKVLATYTRHATNHQADKGSHLEHWVTAFSIHVAHLAPLMKDVAFSEECEWRIICQPKYRTQVKFTPRPAVLSP